VVDTFKKLVSDMFNGAATAKGALIITPKQVIVTTPEADNKKVL
ncbi:pyridoxamine 5'-phosphate oxidase family protein, partial [Clostridium beijerinckii]|nr:pyridoxamine 5'-phosphate oxidase family protein [Clostridium beijerinckii]